MGKLKTLDILCVYEDSNACVFRFTPTCTGKKEADEENSLDQDATEEQNGGHISTISTCKIETCSRTIIQGCFGGRDGAVVLSLGAPTRPHFITVNIEDKENGWQGKLLPLVTVENQQSQSENVVAAGSIPSTVDAPMLLGPCLTLGSKRINVESSANSSNKKIRSGDMNNGDLEEEGAIDWMLGISEVGGEDISLEQRLEILSSAASEQDVIREGKQKSKRSEKYTEAAPLSAPTSDSLVVLIEQALQSGDDALLEQCFECDDAAVVEHTAKRLPTARVVPFLTKLVSKFERRPSRGILLTRWLAAVLRFHTAHLMNVSDLNSRLAGLSQILEQRLSTYTHVASLGGRLDLLFSQSQDMSGNNNHNHNHINGGSVFFS